MRSCHRAWRISWSFPSCLPKSSTVIIGNSQTDQTLSFTFGLPNLHQGLYVRRYGYGPHRITYSIISYTKTYQKYIRKYIYIYIRMIFFCWNSFNELSPASSKRLHSPQAKVAGSFETFEISQGPVERTHPPDALCEPREPWQLGSTRLEMQSCAHPFKQDHHAEALLIKRTKP